MNSQIHFNIVEHGSPEYWETVALRDEELRKPLGLEFSLDQLLAETEDFHLVSLAENKMVACLVLTPLPENRIKMRQVAVHSDWQFKGVGSGIVEFSEEFAKERGFELMELAARSVVVEFYQKLNYDVIGDEFTE